MAELAQTLLGCLAGGVDGDDAPATSAGAAQHVDAEGVLGNVEALVKEGVTDENRAKVLTTIKKHVQTIESLREKVA